ncbi:hypothetical protein LEMA_P100580.1 [Plenodomus lingam JN3]|uniref:Uncharacterized protein n=1 Tax=Leptosphaeria maculans (strain JN3 / isolate v23.1.3 / race Av1-4-5-6-7-8) TaxID=985895 RepID=E5A067_LEPMJ|nr:hypothetical protein LEMA_P100580.1 [Plenodomus lingam JN3]CBX96927.1 hypothetical protein LEMA_P100580.1 [Plenodomus lingam JN3]
MLHNSSIEDDNASMNFWKRWLTGFRRFRHHQQVTVHAAPCQAPISTSFSETPDLPLIHLRNYGRVYGQDQSINCYSHFSFIISTGFAPFLNNLSSPASITRFSTWRYRRTHQWDHTPIQASDTDHPPELSRRWHSEHNLRYWFRPRYPQSTMMGRPCGSTNGAKVLRCPPEMLRRLRRLNEAEIITLFTPFVPHPTSTTLAKDMDPFEPLGRALPRRVRHVPYRLENGMTEMHRDFLPSTGAVMIVICVTSNVLRYSAQAFELQVRFARDVAKQISCGDCVCECDAGFSRTCCH